MHCPRLICSAGTTNAKERCNGGSGLSIGVSLFQTIVFSCHSFHKRELVGARPLHLAAARPFCHLKAPLGLSLFRFAPQTRILQGMNDMRSKFCIFFVYKNLCNIPRLYSKSPDLCSHPCCVKNTSLIRIFCFAIAFDSSRCQSICNTVAIG